MAKRLPEDLTQSAARNVEKSPDSTLRNGKLRKPNGGAIGSGEAAAQAAANPASEQAAAQKVANSSVDQSPAAAVSKSAAAAAPALESTTPAAAQPALAKTASAARAKSPARAAARPSGGILLVDDNQSNLIALEAILRDVGEELVRAHSGQECLRLLFDRDFAVILLDVRMPDMDGYETAELIRKRQRSRHTPIIFITAADARAPEIARGYAVGAVDYIFKPFMPDVLKAKARIFLELHRKSEEIRNSEARLRALVSNLPGAVYRRGPVGEVLFLSDSIEPLCGYPAVAFLSGKRGLEQIVLPEDAEKTAAGLAAAPRGAGAYALEYRIRHIDGRLRWVLDRGQFAAAEAGEPAHYDGVLLDITDRKVAEDSLNDLLGRLLQTQDEERRRIARELHDSTSPLLTGLIGKLYTMRHRKDNNPATARTLDEGLRLAEDTSTTIRNIAYLLHPRLLDENGLLPSLRWYVNGFTQRTGIRITMHLPDELPRYSQEIETALFRVVQEGLTNILRHSGSKAAEIHLMVGHRELLLAISDQGQGMTPDLLARSREGGPLSGIGIAGMRERIRQLGGRFELASSSAGTRITVTLAVP